MNGDTKKPLKSVISDFYKLHMNKGKEYPFKKFKKFGSHKATIYLLSIDGWKRLKKMAWKDEFMWLIKIGYKALWSFEMN